MVDETEIMTFDEAVKALVDAAYEYYGDLDFDASDFYCGITGNIKRRQREHNANFIISVRVENSTVAKEVERAMSDRDFITGKVGNGAKSDSVFVYLYRITADTVEVENS